jgi:hypothetical protein
MNPRVIKFLITAPVWPIALMSSIIATQVPGQTPASIAIAGRSDTHQSCPEPGLSCQPIQTDSSRIEIDKGVSKQFERAWQNSGLGTTGREVVVLIFRMSNGTYTARMQSYTNQYKCCIQMGSRGNSDSPSKIYPVARSMNCC